MNLSRAETDVYNKVRLGKNNKQIADELFVTEKTVKFHLTNIYQKLGVKSRAELIAQNLGVAEHTNVTPITEFSNIKEEVKTHHPEVLPMSDTQRKEITVHEDRRTVVTQQEKVNFIDEKFKIGDSINQLHHMMKAVTEKELNPATVNAACNCVARINETVDTAIKAARFLSER